MPVVCGELVLVTEAYRGGFSLVWFSPRLDVGLVQNVDQRIPFRSSSQVNVDSSRSESAKGRLSVASIYGIYIV